MQHQMAADRAATALHLYIRPSRPLYDRVPRTTENTSTLTTTACARVCVVCMVPRTTEVLSARSQYPLVGASVCGTYRFSHLQEQLAPQDDRIKPKISDARVLGITNAVILRALNAQRVNSPGAQGFGRY